jgi:hypothetical protein
MHCSSAQSPDRQVSVHSILYFAHMQVDEQSLSHSQPGNRRLHVGGHLQDGRHVVELVAHGQLMHLSCSWSQDRGCR